MYVHAQCISAGEQVQENAYVVVRLLIHHSECLGPALARSDLDLCRIYEEALDRMLDTSQFGSSRGSPSPSPSPGSTPGPAPTELDKSPPQQLVLMRSSTSVLSLPDVSDSPLKPRSSSHLMVTDMVLSFYTCLVRLLACCGPDTDQSQGQAGVGKTGPGDETSSTSGSGVKVDSGPCAMKKTDAQRTCSILSNLIPVKDVKGILSLPFARDGKKGIVPSHKEAALLFLSRVYGMTDRHLLLDLLTDAFLPDIKTALKLASVSKIHVHVGSAECFRLT